MTAHVMRDVVPPGENAERMHRYLATILRNTSRMEQLIRAFRDVATLQAGRRLSFERTRQAAAPIAAEAIERFAASAAEKGVSLSSRADLTDVMISCDRHRLLEIFSTLLANAITATPEGGAITVEATHDDYQVTLSVVDDGPGIPVELREAVFDHWARNAARGGHES